jgi:hypothetical protein
MRIAIFATLALVASTVMGAPDNKHGKKPDAPLVINKRVLRTSSVPFIPHTVCPLFVYTFALAC